MANTVRTPTHATSVIFKPTAITVSRRYLVNASTTGILTVFFLSLSFSNSGAAS